MASYHRKNTRPGRPQRQPVSAQPHQRRSHPRRRATGVEGISLVEIDPVRERRAPFGFIVALPLVVALWGGIAELVHAAL